MTRPKEFKTNHPAVKLLKEIVKVDPVHHSYNCFAPPEYVCLYCDGRLSETDYFKDVDIKHDKNCPWLRAKKLVKV